MDMRPPLSDTDLRRLANILLEQTANAAPDVNITVDQTIDDWLATLPKRTRNTYRTHINRFRDGTPPICDQRCTGCITPTRTTLEPRDGHTVGGRRYVFECTCACNACTQSRIGLDPIGDQPVSRTIFNKQRARLTAAIARRNAIKSGIYDNTRRAHKGKPPKNADGAGAEETAVAALRALYKIASEHLGPIDIGDVRKPSRHSGRRRALADYELIELERICATSGNDPELDHLLFELGLAVGARRQATIDITVGWLRPDTNMIRITDKGQITENMPVSADLIERLIAHSIERGGPASNPADPAYNPNQPVFWMRSRRADRTWTPLTARRFDSLHDRWHAELDWAAAEQIGFHYLRHTMSERLKSHYGQHYAQRYLRHADTEVTDRYGRCTDAMLAAAMGDLLGFTHPLADATNTRRQQTLHKLGLTPTHDR